MTVRNKARQQKQQSEVVIVVYVVVLSFLDDNRNNRDNLSANEGNHVVSVVLVVVSYTIRCRAILLKETGPTIIAHCAQNVSFASDNVNGLRRTNRDRNGAAQGENRMSSPQFGRQKFL